jgi:hypothetical protein
MTRDDAARPPDRIRLRRSPKKGRYDRSLIEALTERSSPMSPSSSRPAHPAFRCSSPGSIGPDRDEALASMQDIQAQRLRACDAKFLALTRVRGPIPSDFPDQAPNPADFGLPTEDDGSRDHPLLGPHMLYTIPRTCAGRRRVLRCRAISVRPGVVVSGVAHRDMRLTFARARAGVAADAEAGFAYTWAKPCRQLG